MGLGSQEPRKKIFYMSMRATKDKKTNPHFITQTREGNNTLLLPDETAVSGYLTKIGHGKYEYPENSGKWVQTIELWLVDGGALFKINSTVNTNMARALMNRIIAITNWERIGLRLYVKNDFPNLWVGNNDESIPWKFEYKTQLEPLITEADDPQDPTKKIKIYHKVNELLLNEWIKCEKLVMDNAKNNKTILEAMTISDGTPEAKPVHDSTAHLDQTTQENLKEFETPPPPTDDDLPF